MIWSVSMLLLKDFRYRPIFNISQGDEFVVLGDENSGLALIKSEDFLNFADMVRKNTE
jgi:hypothetical protein